MYQEFIAFFSVLVFAQISGISGKTEIIDGKECESLLCPPHCTLTFRNGCPHNCNCGPLPVCPRVNCPYKFPRCVILTQLDGCQTCACQDPVVILEGDKNDENQRVIFVKTTPFPFSRTTFTLDLNNNQVGRNESATAAAAAAAAAATNSTTIRTTTAAATSRPQIADRFKTTEIPQILAASTTTSGPATVDQLVNLIGPQGTVTRHGDRTLIRFGNESLILSSTTPINFFTPPPANFSECVPGFRADIDRNFKQLYDEILSRKNDATMAFPIAFAYGETDLEQICVNYRKAIDALNGKAIRSCRNAYNKFDEVFSNFEYPCGYGTQSSFFRYYPCLYETRKQSTITTCEQKAGAQLHDPFLNACDAYDILNDCIYPTFVRGCGYDAWEIYYQFLALNVRQYMPSCRLRRIYYRIETNSKPLGRQRSNN